MRVIDYQATNEDRKLLVDVLQAFALEQLEGHGHLFEIYSYRDFPMIKCHRSMRVLRLWQYVLLKRSLFYSVQRPKPEQILYGFQLRQDAPKISIENV